MMGIVLTGIIIVVAGLGVGAAYVVAGPTIKKYLHREAA